MTFRLPALLLVCSLGATAAFADPTPAPADTPAATPAAVVPGGETTPAPAGPTQTQLPGTTAPVVSAAPPAVIATPAPTFGTGSTPSAWPTPTSPAVPAVDGLGRAAAGFFVLLAIAGVGLYFLKNGFVLRGQKGAERRLNVKETRMLGNRQFLVVVEYDNTKMLLGVTPGKIDYLCPLDSGTAPVADFDALVTKETKKTGQS